MQHNDKQNRKIYYVNVQSKQLYNVPDIAPYHLVIMANEEEYQQVFARLEGLGINDEHILSFSTVQLQNDSPEMSNVNKEHDERIQNLYRLLYKLGTDESRKHIEQMQII